MPVERIYLDSNIFIRIFEPRAGDAIAERLLEIVIFARQSQAATFVSSQLTLAEVLIHPIKASDHPKQQYYRDLFRPTNGWLEVQAIDEGVLTAAAGMRARTKVKLPDAIHAATAVATKCDRILTADTDFLTFKLSEIPFVTLPTEADLNDLMASLRT